MKAWASARADLVVPIAAGVCPERKVCIVTPLEN